MADTADLIGLTVYIVDDDADTRAQLRDACAPVGAAVEEFGDARTFLRRLAPDACGCVLLDLHLPGAGGMGVQAELRERRILLPLIFVLGRPDLAGAVAAMRGGAFDVLQKPVSAVTLAETVQSALRQEAGRRAAELSVSEVRARFARLTPRQRQVAGLVVTGQTSRAIAGVLGLREKTVEVYRSQVNAVMGTHSAADLVRAINLLA